jgi:hypothetical protein
VCPECGASLTIEQHWAIQGRNVSASRSADEP